MRCSSACPHGSFAQNDSLCSSYVARGGGSTYLNEVVLTHKRPRSPKAIAALSRAKMRAGSPLLQPFEHAELFISCLSSFLKTKGTTALNGRPSSSPNTQSFHLMPSLGTATAPPFSTTAAKKVLILSFVFCSKKVPLSTASSEWVDTLRSSPLQQNTRTVPRA